MLAELEVQCEPVEDEVAEEVVEIEDLHSFIEIVKHWTPLNEQGQKYTSLQSAWKVTAGWE